MTTEPDTYPSDAVAALVDYINSLLAALLKAQARIKELEA